MVGDYALQGLAVPESLDRVQDLMEQVRVDWPDLDETDLSMFETAIVEIHGNLIEHGHPPGRVIYAFRLEVHADRLVGILADTGDAAPDLSAPGGLPAELEEGGRGLWLARATLDELTYARSGDRNTWKLVRRRTDARGGARTSGATDT